MRIRTIIVGGAIISIIAGFALSKTVVANSPTPGSSEDPVVSKSYVDKAVQDRIQELESKVADLTVQSQALQNTINDLQTKINKGTGTGTKPSTGTTNPGTGTTKPPATGTTPPSGSTTTPPAGNSVVGKKAYAKADNTNIRTSPDGDKLKQVSKGVAMVILEIKKDGAGREWYRITLEDNSTGYVASWVVDVK